MPLTMAIAGERNLIHKVGGSHEVRRHLKNLGFSAGEGVTVVSDIGNNLIVHIREDTIAISREMAGKIMI